MTQGIQTVVMKLQAKFRIDYIQMMYIHELIVDTVQFPTEINI